MDRFSIKMQINRLLGLCLFFCFCSWPSISLSGDFSFAKFNDGKHYREILEYSISQISGASNSEKQRHLRNAARANIMIGDFTNAVFYLSLSLELNGNSEKEKMLLAYSRLISGDIEAWNKKKENLNFKKHAVEILECIDGIKKNDASSLRELSEIKKELEPENEISKNIDSYIKIPRKSKAAALTFGLLLPGGGFAYLGLWRSAATSFILTSILAASSYELFKQDLSFTGVCAGFAASVFYLGGAFNATSTAEDISLNNTKSYREKLRFWALPALSFEF